MATRERIPADFPLVFRVAFGKGPLLLSLPFIAIGAFVVLVGLRVVPVDPSAVHAPWEVVTAAGAIFALGGVTLLCQALRGLAHRARRREMLRLHPGRPWLGDWPWDARGARDGPWRRMLHAWFGLGLFACFLVPFVWWAFLSGVGPWMVKGIVGFLLLITVYMGGSAVHRTLQALRYGTSYVVYEDFPFRLGGEARLRFGPCGSDALTVSLECIEEKFETRGRGNNRSTTNVMNRLYRDRRTVQPPPGMPEIDLRFPLPDDADLATDFSEVPIRYWRLRVRTEAPGPNLDTTLLVPVYSGAPGAPEEGCNPLGERDLREHVATPVSQRMHWAGAATGQDPAHAPRADR